MCQSHLIGGIRRSPCMQQLLHHLHASVARCIVQWSPARLQQQSSQSEVAGRSGLTFWPGICWCQQQQLLLLLSNAAAGQQFAGSMSSY
jgi:hypothetical protein